MPAARLLATALGGALLATTSAYVAGPPRSTLTPRRRATVVFSEERSGPAASTELVEAVTDGYEISLSGLKYKDTFRGDGPTPEKGDTVIVDYVGTLVKGGYTFDSSFARGQPFAFKVGTGQVIPGWDEGISTMTLGSNRTMIIPARLAYGNNNVGEGLIPPNSDLQFEVTLREIKSGPMADLSLKADNFVSGITGAFGLNPFTFFTAALVFLTVAPSVLPSDSPLLSK